MIMLIKYWKEVVKKLGMSKYEMAGDVICVYHC